MGVTHREWIWLGASLLVALATVATLVAFGSYADGQARSLESAADITTIMLGFAIVVVLLLRFGTARRGLAAAAVEERMLRTMDQAKNDLTPSSRTTCELR